MGLHWKHYIAAQLANANLFASTMVEISGYLDVLLKAASIGAMAYTNYLVYKDRKSKSKKD